MKFRPDSLNHHHSHPTLSHRQNYNNKTATTVIRHKQKYDNHHHDNHDTRNQHTSQLIHVIKHVSMNNRHRPRVIVGQTQTDQEQQQQKQQRTQTSTSTQTRRHRHASCSRCSRCCLLQPRSLSVAHSNISPSRAVTLDVSWRQVWCGHKQTDGYTDTNTQMDTHPPLLLKQHTTSILSYESRHWRISSYVITRYYSTSDKMACCARFVAGGGRW